MPDKGMTLTKERTSQRLIFRISISFIGDLMALTVCIGRLERGKYFCFHLDSICWGRKWHINVSDLPTFWNSKIQFIFLYFQLKFIGIEYEIWVSDDQMTSMWVSISMYPNSMLSNCVSSPDEKIRVRAVFSKMSVFLSASVSKLLGSPTLTLACRLQNPGTQTTDLIRSHGAGINSQRLPRWWVCTLPNKEL